MTVILTELVSGSSCRICAMRVGRDYPVSTFFDEQRRDRPGELQKLLTLIKTVSNKGISHNSQKCRYFNEQKLFEFKTPGGLRLFAFWGAEQSLVVCSHGFVKQSQKTPPKELRRATRARETYFESAQKGPITYEYPDRYPF